MRTHRLIAALGVLLGFCDAASADERVSYRATFNLTLVDSPRPVRIEGGQAWTMRQRRCDKWAEEGEAVFTVLPAGAAPIAVRQEYRGEESVNGTSLQWQTTFEIDGRRSHVQASGSAAAGGGGGRIELVHDGVAQRLDLPKGAYFPIAGMEEIAAQLAAGRTAIRQGMFYPGGARRVLDQSVVLEPSAGFPLLPDKSGLLDGPRWPVRIVKRIDGQQNDAVIQLHRNGVISGMILMTMGGARLRYTLASIEPLPETGCIIGQIFVR